MEAAEILRMGYDELEHHPNKRDLMSKAFTYRWGRNAGETQKEANPIYQKAVKSLSDKISKARKRGANTIKEQPDEDSNAE
jgi:hypothetical protein